MVLLIFFFTNISRNATQELTYDAPLIQGPPNYQQSDYKPNNSGCSCCRFNNNEPFRDILLSIRKKINTKYLLPFIFITFYFYFSLSPRKLADLIPILAQHI